MPLTEAMVAGLGSVVTSGINAAAARYTQRKTIEENERIRQQNRAWQLEDRQHDEMYNSPAMQRSRMQDAGIGGDYANMVQPTPTQSQTAQGEGVSLPNFAPFENFGNSAVQGYLQSKMTNASVDEKKAAANKMTIEAAREQIALNYADDYEFQRVNNLKADNLLKEQTLKSDKLAYEIAQNTQGAVEGLAAQALLNAEAEGRNIDADTHLKDMSAQKIGEEITKIIPMELDKAAHAIHLMDTEADLNEEQKKKVTQEIMNLDVQYSLLLSEVAPSMLRSLMAEEQYDALMDNIDTYRKTLIQDIKNGKYDSKVHIINSEMDSMEDYVKSLFTCFGALAIGLKGR